MTERKFEVRDLDAARQTEEYVALKAVYRAKPGEKPNWRDVDVVVSNIIGPLTVRERWELLGDYQLESFRQIVGLEGASGTVSTLMVIAVGDVGYPADLLILKLASDHAINPPLDPSLMKIVNALILDAPKGG